MVVDGVQKREGIAGDLKDVDEPAQSYQSHDRQRPAPLQMTVTCLFPQMRPGQTTVRTRPRREPARQPNASELTFYE